VNRRFRHHSTRLLFVSIATLVYLIAWTRVTVGSADSGNQGNPDNSGQGGLIQRLNVPANFILIGATVIIVSVSIAYLVPLGTAIRKGKVPANVKKPRLILAVLSILIIVAPLGITLSIYRDNVSRVLTPSNLDKISNLFSGQGGLTMPNCTSSWFNTTTRTFGMQFNFTNPTPTDLTIIALSANIADHADNYSLGQISLANPVTAPANETITFQLTGQVSPQAVAHEETLHAAQQSLDVDLSNVKLNFAGILLQMNGTSTINNVSLAS
jgi:hypothetical protein